MGPEIEIWKDIPEYDGVYKISNLGNVLVCKPASRRYKKPYREQQVKKHINSKGYLKVGLCKNSIIKSYPIHRLIAENFIPNPNLFVAVDHINCDKKDNRIENLRWCSPEQNTIYAWQNGLCPIKKGSEVSTAQLTENLVFEIKILLKLNKLKIKEIATLYNVKCNIIYKIKLNLTWTHVSL